MTEHAPKIQEGPSLEWLVANVRKIVEDADHMTAEDVKPGEEEAAIFRLGKYKMEYLQPLLGKMKFESGSDSQVDQSGENEMSFQADDEIAARIMNIEHRCSELEKQKDSSVE